MRTRNITRVRKPQINTDKQPLNPDTYYTIRELTDRTSPHYTVSPATIFRALKSGALVANYVGRKVLLKGAAVKNWIEGGGQ
ncbi:MAG: hypothetical protein HYR56_16915 [Acidobacteria bacterium]|nr:hypothetical protein [Acidobacteriota bacterium]MBI3428019.1 hypothetical protein [Acidobacteriota bacterium]